MHLYLADWSLLYTFHNTINSRSNQVQPIYFFLILFHSKIHHIMEVNWFMNTVFCWHPQKGQIIQVCITRRQRVIISQIKCWYTQTHAHPSEQIYCYFPSVQFFISSHFCSKLSAPSIHSHTGLIIPYEKLCFIWWFWHKSLMINCRLITNHSLCAFI